MRNDLEVVCYESMHRYWIMGVGIPSIIVWGLGIPLFALSLLIRERKRLETESASEKIGFLFRGYKMNYYYWEIIIMFRKIVLIFI